jgi:beta-glucanase (GH16 family)
MLKFFLSFIAAIFFTGSLVAQNWQLVWSDEFNGTQLDAANWIYDLGTGSQFGLNGWGNNELQYYTDQTTNVDVAGGVLTITALEESLNSMDYTSGRIRTVNQQYWTYGKIEARIDLPTGQGIWPAFWMLNEQGFWPGEIDIMEMVGNAPNTIHGTCHYNVPGAPVSSGSSISSATSYADDFHVYAIEWYPDNILWYLDDVLFFQVNRQELAPEYAWLFDIDHYLLLNVAVGGNWPGSPDGSTVFPQEMLVDYVRVYQYDEAATVNDVTFTVDMSSEAILPGDVVHLNGSFNAWCGTCNPLTDLGNGIWTTTISLPPGIHEYKFTTNGWGGLQEQFSQGMPCTLTSYGDPDNFTNRFVNLGFEDTSIGVVCFNSCVGCAGNNYTGCTDNDAVNYDPASINDDGSCLYSVDFSVNMNEEILNPGDIVYLNGSFNGWCGICNPMEDTDQDGIWDLNLSLPDGQHEFKYTTNGWTGLIETFSGGESCTLSTDGGGGEIFVNRVIYLNQSPLDVSTVCFNSCEACPAADVDVVFRVDLYNENLAGESVYLFVDLLGWDASPILMDGLGYGYWETLVNLPANQTVEYAFGIGPNSIGLESVSGPCALNSYRQILSPQTNTVLDLVCFTLCEQCEGCGNPLYLNFNPFSIDNSSFCGDMLSFGCTYYLAENYEPLANTEDGSCVFQLADDCPEDINSDGLISTSDLLLMLATFGGSCN